MRSFYALLFLLVIFFTEPISAEPNPPEPITMPRRMREERLWWFCFILSLFYTIIGAAGIIFGSTILYLRHRLTNQVQAWKRARRAMERAAQEKEQPTSGGASGPRVMAMASTTTARLPMSPSVIMMTPVDSDSNSSAGGPVTNSSVGPATNSYVGPAANSSVRPAATSPGLGAYSPA